MASRGKTPDAARKAGAQYGILRFGAYVPRLRLQRSTILQANGWMAPGLKSLARGERAMANWDEDAVTMGVEAARDCLEGVDRALIHAVHFASTSAPFSDRLNAGIVAGALDLPEDLHSLDHGGSQRAGLSALYQILQARPEPVQTTLLVGAEHRASKAGSAQEMTYGDAAAAFAIGTGEAGLGEPIAILRSSHAITSDFVDHYRAQDREFDYAWEERWIRDAGWMQIGPQAIRAALDKAHLQPADIAHVCLPETLPKIGAALAKKIGFAPESLVDPLTDRLGDAGCAQPLLLLASALETAKAGDKILVLGFGQGAQVLIFEMTRQAHLQPGQSGVSGHLARRRSEENYLKFLAFNDRITLDRGMRAEVDKQTPLSSLFRNRRFILGLVGGQCTKCNTVQIPKASICVNPDCGAMNSQIDHGFSEKTGEILSYTADHLTFAMDPPQHFGMVQFPEGGRLMLDFTDVDLGHVAVGQKMRMMFRIKDVDHQRGFTRYFWKAAPLSHDV